jgi:Mce-associated membrane protein
VAGERARSRAAGSPVAPKVTAAPPSPHAAPPAPAVREVAPVSPETAPAASTPAVTAPAASASRRWAAPVAALVASLALLAVLLGVTWRDPQQQSTTDRVAASAARASIEQMLSYNYKTIDAQAAQIETLLTGPFKAEFTSAMDKEIKPLAVKNQTVVEAKVSDIGVMSSSGSTVRVLAFVNQARVGADHTTPAVDQNRVIATMSKVGDRWLVSKVEAF